MGREPLGVVDADEEEAVFVGEEGAGCADGGASGEDVVIDDDDGLGEGGSEGEFGIDAVLAGGGDSIGVVVEVEVVGDLKGDSFGEVLDGVAAFGRGDEGEEVAVGVADELVNDGGGTVGEAGDVVEVGLDL